MFFTFVLKVALFISRVRYETTNDFLLLQCTELLELVLVLVLIAGNDERRMYRRISPVFAAQILTQSYAKIVSQRPKKKSDYEWIWRSLQHDICNSTTVSSVN